MMLFDGRPAVAMDLLLLQGKGCPAGTSCCEREGRPAAREGAAGCRRRRPDGGRRDREAAAAMNHERTSSKVLFG